jgi:hypothetical protein
LSARNPPPSGKPGIWWRVVNDVNDRPVGNPKRRFDEYGSKFSLSYANQGMSIQSEKAKLKKVMLASLVTL